MRTLAAIALVAASLAIAAPAQSATTAPCVQRYAAAPYVSRVDHGNAVIGGAGQIGGCPKAAGTVSITVALQRNVDGTWVDQATPQTFTRSWPTAYRYARQAGGSVYAACVPGQWRTDARGGDGYAPSEWASPVVTFSTGDSGVCGSYGGGDKRQAPSCANEGPLLAIANGQTQAYVEDHVLQGYTGSLNETVHRGDGGTWDLKGKWYDLCGSNGGGSQVSYRRNVEHPDGWHVKNAAYHPS